MMLSICVEPAKPRVVIDARALNDCYRHVSLQMDSAAWVADAAERIYVGNLDDCSGFDNGGLQPESWSIVRVVRGHGLRAHYRPDRLEREPGMLPFMQ